MSDEELMMTVSDEERAARKEETRQAKLRASAELQSLRTNCVFSTTPHSRTALTVTFLLVPEHNPAVNRN